MARRSRAKGDERRDVARPREPRADDTPADAPQKRRRTGAACRFAHRFGEALAQSKVVQSELSRKGCMWICFPHLLENDVRFEQYLLLVILGILAERGGGDIQSTIISGVQTNTLLGMLTPERCDPLVKELRAHALQDLWFLQEERREIVGVNLMVYEWIYNSGLSMDCLPRGVCTLIRWTSSCMRDLGALLQSTRVVGMPPSPATRAFLDALKCHGVDAHQPESDAPHIEEEVLMHARNMPLVCEKGSFLRTFRLTRRDEE